MLITTRELECATSISCASTAAAAFIFTGCQGVVPYLHIPGMIFLGAAALGIAIFIALMLGTMSRKLIPRIARHVHIERLRVLVASVLSNDEDGFGTLINVCICGVAIGFIFGGVTTLLCDGDLSTRIGYGALVWAVTPEILVISYLVLDPIANALHARWRQ